MGGVGITASLATMIFWWPEILYGTSYVRNFIPQWGMRVRKNDACGQALMASCSRPLLAPLQYDNIIEIIYLEEPVRVASPHRINLEEPGQGGQPT